jgi:hypothetical protein
VFTTAFDHLPPSPKTKELIVKSDTAVKVTDKHYLDKKLGLD